MSKNNGGKVKFSIDKTGFFAESAIFLLIMAMAFRFIGCWGMWTDRVNAIMMILLPICCCLRVRLYTHRSGLNSRQRWMRDWSPLGTLP